MLFAVDRLIEGQAPAVHLFSGPYYFAEQLGFRKILDTTFMIGMMIHNDPDPEDLRKFYRALRRAQRDLDLRPEQYTHYSSRNFPSAITPRWTPGAGGPERLVFEPYTKEFYEDARDWIAKHGIFPDGNLGTGEYDRATMAVS